MPNDLTPEQNAVLEKLASTVVRRGLTAPAILALASLGPLSFVASQAMLFFAPIASAIFDTREYELMQSVLERREGVELLLTRIEDVDARRGRT